MKNKTILPSFWRMPESMIEKGTVFEVDLIC